MNLLRDSYFLFILRKDRVFGLLFLNSSLVIIGYALAVASGMATVGPMKIFKTLLFFASLGLIFTERDWRAGLKATKHTTLIIALCMLLPAFALISRDVLTSLNRTASFLLPFVYVWLSVSILVYRYGQKEMLRLFSSMILVIYSIPMLSFVLFGGDFSGESIYGQQEGQVFVSNHFGWSACLFLLASFHALRHGNRPLGTKVFLGLFILLAVYLLIVSGNRASMLSVALALLIMLFYYRGVSIFQKILILTSPVLLIWYLVVTENDAVTFIINRTQRQQELGREPRLERLQLITRTFSESPGLWLTGTGLFNYDVYQKEGVKFTGYHNSYFILLFGLGIPLFILFMVFMLFEPTRQFTNRVSKYDLVLIPLLIIPFFEGNLTGGQFLFYPWFSYIFALNSEKKYAIFGKRNWFYFTKPAHVKEEIYKSNNAA